MKSKIIKKFFGEQTIKERFQKETLFPCLLFTFILFLYGPLGLANNSVKYMNCTLIKLFPYIFAVFMIAYLVLTVFVMIFSREIRGFIILLLTGFSFAFLIQGVINPDLGVLDGTPINWTKYAKTSLKNILLWGIILSVPFIIRYCSKDYWSFLCKVSSIVFVAILSVSLIISVIPEIINEQKTETSNSSNKISFGKKSNNRVVLSQEDLYTFGNKENVVFIVLDATDNYDLNDTLKQYPDMLNSFNDFTRYDNYNIRYYGTFPSACYYLTQADYECDKETYAEYFSKAWNSEKANSFYKDISALGYRSNVYIEESYISKTSDDLTGKISNAIVIDDAMYTINWEAFKKLFFLSFYYHFPIGFKAPFRCDTSELTEMFLLPEYYKYWNATDAVKEFWNNGITTGDFEKLFTYIHLQGAHPPYYLPSDGRPGDKDDIYSVTETLAGHFNVLSEMIQYMKDLKIYEDSLIIIAADHGACNKTTQPILFVKKPFERHVEMENSHAPVSQENILPTIAETIGMDSKRYGKTIDDIPENAMIERCWRMLSNDENYPNSDHRFNVLNEYCYTGDGEAFSVYDYLKNKWILKDYFY